MAQVQINLRIFRVCDMGSLEGIKKLKNLVDCKVQSSDLCF